MTYRDEVIEAMARAAYFGQPMLDQVTDIDGFPVGDVFELTFEQAQEVYPEQIQYLLNEAEVALDALLTKLEESYELAVICGCGTVNVTLQHGGELRPGGAMAANIFRALIGPLKVTGAIDG